MNAGSPLPDVPSTRAASARPASRLPWLDGLRGLAALAVVLHHLYVCVLHYYPADSALIANGVVHALMVIGRWGVLGVPCFFVLSGFCVGQTWQHAKSPLPFALRRWRRIFPAYYASLALVLLCVAVARLVTGVNDITPLPALTPGNLIATLTLTTNPVTDVPTLSWVYWTLSYEVAFYLVLTALLALPVRFRLIVLIGVHTLACVAGSWWGSALSPGPWFFAELWPLFGLGLALALLAQSRFAAGWIGAVSLLALLPLQLTERHPGFAATGLVAAALVWACLANVSLPRFRPLETLGEFSYSLYLTHVPILLVGAKYLFLRPQQTPAMLLAGWAAATLVMVLAAYAFYRGFEKPFLHARPRTHLPAPA
jgi:peptidoglycan/LPS O-acetylase OafA/YrhL